VKVNPEFAMKAAIKKFIRRFSFVENTLRDEGMSISEASMEEMDRLWNISKEKERKK
jgi:uncharacterized protein YabN with tetrapyrrole methylase and pyrophosphatase domain